MLAVERQVTRALLTQHDAATRRRTEEFVEASLRDMPEHLRAGVLVESVAVAAAITAVRVSTKRSQPEAVEAVLRSLTQSRIGLLRQYPRLFRSLTVFGECEAADTVPA